MIKNFYIASKKDYISCLSFRDQWAEIVMPAVENAVKKAFSEVFRVPVKAEEDIVGVLKNKQFELLSAPVAECLDRLYHCPADLEATNTARRLCFYNTYNGAIFWDGENLYGICLNGHQQLRTLLENHPEEYVILDANYEPVSYSRFCEMTGNQN